MTPDPHFKKGTELRFPWLTDSQSVSFARPITFRQVGIAWHSLSEVIRIMKHKEGQFCGRGWPPWKLGTQTNGNAKHTSHIEEVLCFPLVIPTQNQLSWYHLLWFCLSWQGIQVPPQAPTPESKKEIWKKGKNPKGNLFSWSPLQTPVSLPEYFTYLSYLRRSPQDDNIMSLSLRQNTYSLPTPGQEKSPKQQLLLSEEKVLDSCCQRKRSWTGLLHS